MNTLWHSLKVSVSPGSLCTVLLNFLIGSVMIQISDIYQDQSKTSCGTHGMDTIFADRTTVGLDKPEIANTWKEQGLNLNTPGSHI